MLQQFAQSFRGMLRRKPNSNARRQNFLNQFRKSSFEGLEDRAMMIATPYSMAGGNYLQDFADIANWTNDFLAGAGAANWGSVAVNATGVIPDGVRTTVSSATFSSGSSGGVQRGTGTLVLLTTGTTDSSAAVAADLYLDFSGRTAGTLSFDWAQVNNSTGNRGSTLKAFTSTDGTTWTELAGSTVAVFNNVAASGTVSAVQLPTSFNNSATARIRFYEFNGTGGTTGSRAKISIDNVAVTSTAAGGANVGPTNTVPGAQSTNEDIPLVFSTGNGNAISISDPDAGAANLQVSLSVTTGTLTLSGLAGLAGTGNGSNTLQYTGTAAALNAALQGLSYSSPFNSSGSDTLSITTDDLGNTGTGGPLTDSDTVNITITAQNDAPTILNNVGLTVAEGAAATVITNAMLQVSDIDNVAANLIYTVTVLPTGGVLANNGTAVPLNGTFTQADIDAGLITYAHNGGEAASDSLTFTVSDGSGGLIPATQFAVTVTPLNDTPTIGLNLGFTVAEASAANAITNAVLLVNDVDNTPAQLLYTLTTLPTNGTLALNGTPLVLNDTFTQADINNNLLTYSHNGSETTSDSFHFTVADGAGGTIADTTFAITVSPTNDSPVLSLNAGLTVAEGAAATVIGNAQLLVTDVDSSATQIVYTVTAVPANGTSALNSVALAANDTFTQADVNAGLLSYAHNGSETLGDLFTFTVSDSAGGSIAATNFAITVTPVNDAPLVATNLGLTVAEGAAATVIDNTRLLVSDVDTAASAIVFTVTAVPANGTLSLNGTPLLAGGMFTQANVNSGLLTYAHYGSETLSDQFTFTVSDGAGGSIPATNFLITVQAANDAPLLVTNSGLTNVPLNLNVVLSNTNLLVTDVDNTAAQLVYTLGSAPAGTLTLAGFGVLIGGGTFTQDDFNTGKVSYTAPAAGAADSFTFIASDGTASLPSATFNITLVAVNTPPTVAVNTVLLIAEAATAIITNTQLQVTDAEQSATALTYTVTAIPSNGTLLLNGTPLVVSDTFTQANIDSGLLTYAHNGSETPSDTFHFTVSDGAGGTIPDTTFTITVSAVNDAPTLTNNTGLTVLEGAAATVITSAQLLVEDVDNAPLQIQYTVTAVPVSGTLAINGVALLVNDTFTQSDIDGGLLTYAHDGSETTSDSFHFTVSDGGNGAIGDTTFSITVMPQNDAPVIVNNTGITVAEGAVATVISSAQLSVSDVDNGPVELVFTVTAIPAQGTLALNGVPLAVNDTFTPADINNGLLTYAHDGSETTSDGFGFTVSDGSGGVIPPTLFAITVTAVNDPPTVTTNLGMTVAEGATATVVANTQLQVSDVDNTAAEIVYTLTTAPVNGTLALNGTPLIVNSTFTQADLNAGVLTYAHNGSETTSDSFAFTVSDGASGSIPTTMFAITVTASNDVPTITTNLGLTVAEGAAATPITSAQLQVSDADNAAGQLVYTITNAPTNGTLALNGTPLIANGTFTQADIDAGLLTYAHNGSETASDSFAFSVSDGAGGSIPTTGFAITVTAVNDAPAVTTNLGLTVAEGAAATSIANTLLQVTDADTVPAQIVYTLTAVPTNGILALNGTPLAVNGTFTQFEINTGALTYAHNGSETTSDSFAFTVSDGVASIPATTFAITVTPTNDAPTLAPQGFTIAENSANGTSVGTVIAGDVDVGDTKTFAITAGNDNGAFAINPSTGEITVANSALLNFEAGPSIPLTVRVTDSGNLTASNTVTITLTDVVEPVGITVTPTTGLITTEAGGTATFTVVLTSQPTADVTIALSSDNTVEGTVAPANVTFTSLNWNVPQTVTVTGVNDAVDDGDIAYTILTGTATSTDVLYAGFNPMDVAVTNLDDDAQTPPTISDIADQTTNEGTVLNAIPFTVGDAETAPGSLVVTASSSDTTLFPPGSITLGGSGANRTISLSPAANLSGTATITVTVEDGDGSTTTDTFTVQVTAVNDAPTLDPIAAVSLPNNPGLQTIGLTGITAGGGETQTLTVTATSSNPALLPDPSITYTSPGSTGSLSFTPVAGQSGTAMITVTVTDDGGTANGGVNMFTRTFTVTIAPAITQPGLVTVVPDPKNPGQGLLVVNGTNSLDLITVLRVGNRTLVLVPLSGVLRYFDKSTFGRVLINGLNGHDRIILDPNLPVPATINGDAGNDLILSGAGNDVIHGGIGSDIIFGRAGNDFLYGDAGADFLYGEAGKDVLIGAQDNDWLSGGAEGDIINGGEGLDTILGDGGDDLIISGNFSDANNMTELHAIQAIWTSSQPFNTRITSLAGKINSTTVTSDGKFDWVYTGAGRDWAVDYALMDLLFDFNYNPTNGDKRN